ncbi:U4/U6 small nuclear ribonucleoprotein Prp31 [Caligus rogercresseyi]|uniref:U4/U6 small nuclear ribonucleoprotein Prp31 n=1 Tax=Caligus rogercresseyi TaxID=217165 RepID=A0A7T8QVJ0_CALRO|nr:U4/U6 small nuclear ribonucleoprotein Prp31 [Caligus rogercresseyi]
MSLAEELLADLEEEEDDDGVKEEMEGLLSEIKEEPLDNEESAMEVDQGSSQDLHSVAKLLESNKLKDILRRIEEYSAEKRCADPEYILIVEANNVAAEIDDEIGVIHKFAKTVYSVNPLEYLMTAKELGNHLETAKKQCFFGAVFESGYYYGYFMDISPGDLSVVNEACDMAVTLNDSKKIIFDYVSSRMTFIAPNLSAIVGPSTAAKVMGAAGGLTNLSKMPSNNISLLGQTKKHKSGFSQKMSFLPHTGFIYYSELVQSVPPDIRRKCTLAARVDSFHQSEDGTLGREFREEIEKKIDKLQEPPPVKATKALPAPIEAPKKRRGGRRVRKMKEHNAVTELRKQRNRMNFGEVEEDVYQNDLSYTRGNIGKSGIGGGIRMAQIDERTKVKISQTLKKNLQKQQAYGGATSRCIYPTTGLEIVNPHAAEKSSTEENAKYFSASAAFRKISTPAPKTT